MIHQLTFRNPKPGMSIEEFQRYWIKVHAVKYAGKIPQIKKFLIDSVIPYGEERPIYKGIGEIWFENEEEQLASLQSEEFIKGVRADEPNWAAFWETITLDTTSYVILEGKPSKKDPAWTKVIALFKRKAGMILGDFRRYSLKIHAPLALQLPGVRRYIQGHVCDSFYAIGEPRFDSVSQLWFDNTKAIDNMFSSPEFNEKVKPDSNNFTDPKYTVKMLAEEHWIIGP